MPQPLTPFTLMLTADWYWYALPLALLVLVLIAYLSLARTHVRTRMHIRSALLRRYHLKIVDDLQPSTSRVQLLGTLSPRESEIARRVAEGKRNKEIAAELSISVHTVETHLTHIYQKLGVSNRVELTRAIGDLLVHP